MSGAIGTGGSATSHRSVAAWTTAVTAPASAWTKNVPSAGLTSTRSAMALARSYCMTDMTFRYSPRKTGELVTSRMPTMRAGSGAVLADE